MYYDIDKRIGKQVWVFGGENLNQDKVWNVAELHEPDDTHYDYYFTLVCGEETMETYWYETVVLPKDNTDEITRIYTYLHDNGFYDDGVWDERILDTKLICIGVSWGDWKHDHLWLDALMEHLGYDCFGVIVTEENGSDCYSANHTYVHKSNPRYEVLMAAKKIFA